MDRLNSCSGRCSVGFTGRAGLDEDLDKGSVASVSDALSGVGLDRAHDIP